jgi:hypothetical protein
VGSDRGLLRTFALAVHRTFGTVVVVHLGIKSSLSSRCSSLEA